MGFFDIIKFIVVVIITIPLIVFLCFIILNLIVNVLHNNPIVIFGVIILFFGLYFWQNMGENPDND